MKTASRCFTIRQKETVGEEDEEHTKHKRESEFASGVKGYKDRSGTWGRREAENQKKKQNQDNNDNNYSYCKALFLLKIM